jgi:hypothetical protein
MSDLWPSFTDIPKKRTPHAILEEQAALLGDKTQNIVQAETKRSSTSMHVTEGGIVNAPFFYEFFIKAPILKYKYKLFSIAHDVFLYPTTFYIDNDIEEEILQGKMEDIIAHDEEEYIALLQKIFNSKKTIKIIQSILGQLL